MVTINEYPNYQINEQGVILNTSTGRVKQTHVGKTGKDDYYVRVTLSKGTVATTKKLLLHRVLAQVFIPNPNNFPYVDHIDRNSLNNSLDNLRWCSKARNVQNKTPSKTGTSKYMGVCKEKGRNKWVAGITLKGKRLRIGRYLTELEAALAYDEVAIAHGYDHHNGLLNKHSYFHEEAP